MLTVTDLFCGAGGSSTGAVSVPGVQIRIAANHWDLAVESHNTNHPEADHACVDLHMEDPRFFPRTDILWASPECTKWSQANGNALPAIEEGLFEDPLSDDAATRSRLLMFDVLRFVEHHRYEAIVVENVVDIATQPKYRLAWQVWRQGLRSLGYDFRVVSLNSMHAQHLGAPAPQSRDRIYIVAWKCGNRAPDIDAVMRPKAWCVRCDGIVESAQAFKPGRSVGKYRAQYVYVCTACATSVQPAYLPAAAAIDWSLPGERIGDRAKPLAPKTMARIRAGLAKYGVHAMHLEAAGNTFEHGTYRRIWPIDEPLRTLHTSVSKALVVPVEGRDGKAASWTGDPLRTQTARNETGIAFIAELRGGGSKHRPVSEPLATVTASGNHHALIMRNNTARGNPAQMVTPVTEPMRTLTTTGHQSLLVPYYGNGQAQPTGQSHRTFTTVDRFALMVPAGGTWNDDARPTSEVMRTRTTRETEAICSIETVIEDCRFRMLEPHEIGAGMAFPDNYIVLGNKREKVRQYGNAVTPPAARDLISAVAESLGVNV